jgi:hypothetical protein
VNEAFAAWAPAAVPADRTRLREQCELTHAARAGLFPIGFSALLPSVLALRPGGAGRGETTG